MPDGGTAWDWYFVALTHHARGDAQTQQQQINAMVQAGADAMIKKGEATMLTGMVVMAFGFWFYSIAAVLMRARCIMLERERASEWVVEYAKGPA